MVQATGSSFSDPTASLDAGNHVVSVVAGPIPSVLALVAPLDRKLLQASGRHCYTPARARTLVRRALTGGNVKVVFALTQEPVNGQMAYAQRAYEHGCTMIASITAALYGRVVDAQLYSKSAPAGAPATGQEHAPSVK